MTDPAVTDEAMRLALVRGFTRSDLLLMGELVDLTPVASKLGFIAPVAMSRGVQDETEALASLMGMGSSQAIRKLLLSLVEAVRGQDFYQDETIRFNSAGYQTELFVHAASDADGRWYLTVYTTGEKPALV